jgi:hypothetical protein
MENSVRAREQAAGYASIAQVLLVLRRQIARRVNYWRRLYTPGTLKEIPFEPRTIRVSEMVGTVTVSFHSPTDEQIIFHETRKFTSSSSTCTRVIIEGSTGCDWPLNCAIEATYFS